MPLFDMLVTPYVFGEAGWNQPDGFGGGFQARDGPFEVQVEAGERNGEGFVQGMLQLVKTF